MAMSICLLVAVGGMFALLPRQGPRDRVDRDSVTDPIPAWDHHTLARGLSVPLSRCLRILKNCLPQKYFVGVGRNAPLVGMEGHRILLLRSYSLQA